MADKVGNAGLIGALVAAVGALALACRARGAKMDRSPTGFPSDPNAALKKYQNAYSQLVSLSTTATTESGLGKEGPATAIDYALIAFEEAKGPSQGLRPQLSSRATSGASSGANQDSTMVERPKGSPPGDASAGGSGSPSGNAGGD